MGFTAANAMGMAWGATSSFLSSYVSSQQQNNQLTVSSAAANLQSAQAQIAAAQTAIQAEQMGYQATMSEIAAQQTDEDRNVAKVNYNVQLAQIAKNREKDTRNYKVAQADTKARLGAANIDATSGSALSVLTGNAAQYGSAMAENTYQRKLADYQYNVTDSKLKTQALMQRNQAEYYRSTKEYYQKTGAYYTAQSDYYSQMSSIYSGLKTSTGNALLNALGNAGMGAMGGLLTTGYTFTDETTDSSGNSILDAYRGKSSTSAVDKVASLSRSFGSMFGFQS